jgi:hypothetical protein
MEYKIWEKSGKRNVVRYFIIGMLIFFWLIMAIKSNQWIHYLLMTNFTNHFIADNLWTGMMKFLFYAVHILINFLIFLFISGRMRYAMIMLVATVLILLIKEVSLIASKGTIMMPMQLPLYVDVVLIFSLAGYFISKKA